MARLDVDGPKGIYYEHHAGDGPAVVLVHGWGMSARVWDLNLASLIDAGHEVVAFDQRCCGASDKDFADVSVAANATDVARVIEAAGVSDPIVVGWSFGAAVTAQAAIDAGTSLRGIVLIGPPTPRYVQAPDFPHGGTPEILAETVAALRTTRPTFLHGLAQGVCHADVGAPTIDWMWSIFLQTSPGADAGLTDLGRIDHRQALPGVSIPALVCSGDHDTIADPAIAAVAAELLPRSRLVRFSESGHAPFIEEREAFDQALLGFTADPAAAVAGSSVA